MENIVFDRVRTEAGEMDYFRFGRGGRTLVILPGLSVQSVMGAAQAVAEEYSVMKEQFTVFLFDRRRNLPARYPISDMARDTAEAFRALGLREVCLFGASQGGMIALELAAEYPELVNALAVCSTAAKASAMRRDVPEEWLRLARAGDGKGLYLAFGRAIYPAAVFDAFRDALAAAGEGVTREEMARFVILAEGTGNFDMSGRLPGIQCPVLAAASEDDQVIDPDAAREIAEGVPGAALLMYEGFGHAVYDTAPDFREKLYAFFERIPEKY